MSRNQAPCRTRRRGRCRRSKEYLDYYNQIVDAYIRDHRVGAEAELRDFRGRATLEEVITRAAWCMTRDDKRHPHHYRRSEGTLEQAERVLQARADDMSCCVTFDELHRLVWDEIYTIKWIKRLYAYDVATWIGAYLGLEPDMVYPHAGAGEGAKALGFETQAPIDPTRLPEAFQRLRIYEMEDCLCIYKDDLYRIANSVLALFN